MLFIAGRSQSMLTKESQVEIEVASLWVDMADSAVSTHSSKVGNLPKCWTGRRRRADVYLNQSCRLAFVPQSMEFRGGLEMLIGSGLIWEETVMLVGTGTTKHKNTSASVGDYDRLWLVPRART